MLTSVIDYFNSICGMPKELIDDLLKLTVVKEFKKDEFILESGKISDYTSWILKGVCRHYYVKDTEEITTKFLWEKAAITSVNIYYSRKPGNENIVALEDTTLAVLHYDQMQYLYKTYPAFNVIGRVITEQYLYMPGMKVYNLRKSEEFL